MTKKHWETQDREHGAPQALMAIADIVTLPLTLSDAGLCTRRS